MNPAVSLVDAYLQVNGYFTVVEYPVIERGPTGYREATDLDILAFRFAGAGRRVPGLGRPPGRLLEPDRALGIAAERADMVIAEVKEGKASINRSTRRREVVEAALGRFGCCDPESAGAITRRLLARGRADMDHGHVLRLVAFGSLSGSPGRGVQTILLGHVARFLTEHVRAQWNALSAAQFTHPALGMLITLEKARRGGGSSTPDERMEEDDP